MQYQFARALLVLLIATGVAVAQTRTPQTLTLGQFDCANSLDGVQFTDGRVRIHNFTLSETKSTYYKNEPFFLNFTASVANRSDDQARVLVEAVGFDDKQSISFAVTTDQPWSSIDARKTETISGRIFVTPGTLKRTSKFCLRVNGEI